MALKAVYISAIHEFPSRQAHTIQIMNTCGALSRCGFDLQLVIPDRGRHPTGDHLSSASPWAFYGVPETFGITYLPTVVFGTKAGYAAYALTALAYASLRRTELYYFRQMELAYLSALSGRATVFETHNHERNIAKRLCRHWVRSMQERQRQVGMVVTTQVAAQAYGAIGVPQNRILVAPNGVNVVRFRTEEPRRCLRESMGLPQSVLLVGYAGQLYQKKGIEELMECARLLDRFAFLLVGGERRDVERWRSFAQQQNLHNVRLTGFVPQASLPAYLLACDILVMPQATRPDSAMKVFDYMACGLPIVSTDFPSVRELLQHRHNALLVPPGSGQALAAAIRWLAAHAEDAALLGRQARRDSEQYSWENRGRRIASWVGDWLDL